MLAKLTKVFSVDGMRLDSASHVNMGFWPELNSAAGVYCIGEIFDDRPSYVCPYQEVLDGVLNYPTYVCPPFFFPQ